MLLSQAADLIYTLFDRNGAKFLQEGIFFLGDIGLSLATQLAQLSALEIEVLQTITQARHSLYPDQLWLQLASLPTKQHYFHALQNLKRSFLIYQEDAKLKLSDLMLAYLSDQNDEAVENTIFSLPYPIALVAVPAAGD